MEECCALGLCCPPAQQLIALCQLMRVALSGCADEDIHRAAMWILAHHDLTPVPDGLDGAGALMQGFVDAGCRFPVAQHIAQWVFARFGVRPKDSVTPLLRIAFALGQQHQHHA